MTFTFFPVVLAGGSGTRLWPLSRKNFPKQFLCLNGERSLLQQTLERVKDFITQEVIIVSNDAHYFLCQEQLQALNLPATYILEPCPRNTAPAIACAAHYLFERIGPNALLLILPSDHWVAEPLLWQNAMRQAGELAMNQSLIITFGVMPNRPEIGYGYIEGGERYQMSSARQVVSFREKPNRATAVKFLADGNYFWNSGMFVVRAGVYLDELKKYAPDIFRHTQSAMATACRHHDFLRLDDEAFAACRNESIDYALMEHTTKAAVIPMNTAWSDLGCWSAVASANEVDEQGNVVSDNVITQDTVDCFIRSENTLVTTMGIKSQIIIATADAVLVADKKHSQQVKALVDKMSSGMYTKQLADHVRVTRPWGHFEVLAEGVSFKVKRLMLKPGAKLSLQMHQHRAEHWVVVAGEAEVINGEKTFRLKVNQSTYIPKETQHRLTNPGPDPLYIIEVQSGSYLGEDDIQRFEDVYYRKISPVVEM